MERSSPPIHVFDTTFQNPILLAAGTAGFGREVADVIDLDHLGGLITKAVSVEPRQGHAPPRVAEFSGGMLNAVGLANPGLEYVADTALPWLSEQLTRARVIVNVVGWSVDDYATVVRTLTDFPIVTAFELNVSCPNTERGNVEFGADRSVLADLVSRCRQVSSKPVIVKLAPNLGNLGEIATVAAEFGADGFAVVNTMPGSLYRSPNSAGNTVPRLGFGRGGVSGPALLAIGVLATHEIHERTDCPIIGVGGVRTSEDVNQYIAAGATLVGVGTAALANPRVPENLVAQWERRG